MIKGTHKNISPTSGDLIPEGLRESAKDLELLLKAYYEWTDQDGNFQKESRVLADAFSYKTAPDDYLPYFKETLLRLFPNASNALLKHLLKFSKTFYAQRGTPESYEFLFNAIWGEKVSIEYPRDYIMRSSDGIWKQNTLLKVHASDDMNALKGRRLYGKESNANCVVSDYFYNTGSETPIATLVIDNLSGTFNDDELLETEDNFKKIKTRAISSYGNYRIINSGKGYSAGKIIPLKTMGDGNGFSAKINTVGLKGEIISLDIIEAGVNYVYEAPELDLESDDIKDSLLAYEPAEIELIKTTVYKDSGRYKLLKSSVSDVFKLQDGHYYQQFSYVINTNLKYEDIYQPVKELLHPAGTKMFITNSYNLNSFTNNQEVLFYRTRWKLSHGITDDISKENENDTGNGSSTTIDYTENDLINVINPQNKSRIFFDYEKYFTLNALNNNQEIFDSKLESLSNDKLNKDFKTVYELDKLEFSNKDIKNNLFTDLTVTNNDVICLAGKTTINNKTFLNFDLIPVNALSDNAKTALLDYSTNKSDIAYDYFNMSLDESNPIDAKIKNYSELDIANLLLKYNIPEWTRKGTVPLDDVIYTQDDYVEGKFILIYADDSDIFDTHKLKIYINNYSDEVELYPGISDSVEKFNLLNTELKIEYVSSSNYFHNWLITAKEVQKNIQPFEFSVSLELINLGGNNNTTGRINVYSDIEEIHQMDAIILSNENVIYSYKPNKEIILKYDENFLLENDNKNHINKDIYKFTQQHYIANHEWYSKLITPQMASFFEKRCNTTGLTGNKF